MTKKNSLLSRLYIVLCFVFLYLPILVTTVFSFNSSKSLTRFTGFSLRWYAKLLRDESIISAVYVSLSIAIIATFVATVFGTITAIGISRNRKLIKNVVLNINNIPIVSPDIVLAIGLMILFTSLHFPRGYMTMLISHIVFCMPFVITSVYPKVRSLPPNLADAAMDLGATPLQTLLKVVVPMLKPGIFAGILLSFTISLDDFVVSFFVTGNGVSNISIVVYNMTKRMNPVINALSAVLIAVSVLIMVGTMLIPKMVKKRRAHRTLPTARSVAIRKWSARFVVFIGIALIAVFSVKGWSAQNKKTLRVFNGGEYVDMELIKRFEEENDCKVLYETFDSNESMYTKIKSGSEYDIIITSDYMIERLKREKYLSKLDTSQITRRDKVIPSLLKKNFDPKGEYSIPYYWGSVGILYDKTKVDTKDLKEGWNLLANPKYSGKLYMYDSSRDTFMIALKVLGYSMNTDNKKEINQAYEWLAKQGKVMNPVYVGDDVMDNMISSNKALAVVYSGDASYIIDENSDMDFFIPEQGSNVWTDSMVMTKFCENKKLAHKYMDFFLDHKVAVKNTKYIGYDSGVKSVYNYFKKEYYKGNSGCGPDISNPLNEEFTDQKNEIKKYMDELWTKIKTKR